ncbi:hypothetical protein [Kordiimonas marina]|uniref:hypothetical protein n=1 Tax=Kordiimonas marina TaxID=2872312 RepID=UPI001FF52775|nr:hypothetical protein [Kordiimonas marina]MCJ9429059.1 hypothetical protein [Kordiimonas marina]
MTDHNSSGSGTKRLIDKLSYNQISLISIALYIPALLLPTPFDIDGQPSGFYPYGWFLLLLGWLGLFSCLGAWLANPLIIYAWAANRGGRHKQAFRCGLAATLFTLIFLFVQKIEVNEAGHMGWITGYNAGYWFWLASCGTFTLLQGLKHVRETQLTTEIGS